MKGFLDGRVIPVSPGILIGMGQSQPDMWVKIVHMFMMTMGNGANGLM